MSSYYFTLCIIAIFIYFLWSEPNLAMWIYLQVKTVQVEIQMWILKQKIKRGMPSDMQKFIAKMEREQAQREKEENGKNKM